MTMRFDLIGAGVLAPGIGSIDTLIDIASKGVQVPPPGIGTGVGNTQGMSRSETAIWARTPTTRVRDLASFWTARQPVEPFVAPPVLALPANERRRASPVARLALACAEQALAHRPELASCVRLVFAADEGVGDVCQMMLEALTNDRPVSPLIFANSVHNAPSGYFSIAHGNQRPATSLSLGEQSFACGLMTAVAEAQGTGQPVLLVCYDSPMPMPLRSLLPIGQPSATAWLIATSEAGAADTPASSTARTQHPLASFRAELVETQVRDGCDAFDVEPLRMPLDHRPAWLHDSWALNSSALGIAALGLLASAHGGVRDYSLGKQALRLSLLQGVPGASGPSTLQERSS